MNVLMLVMLHISGQAGGTYYNSKGGGSNYLCLPNDPDNGKPHSHDNDVLYGAEYETGGSYKTSGLGDNLQNKEVPCAVCRHRGKSSVLMIPGIRFIFQIFCLIFKIFLYITSKRCFQLMKYLSDISNKTAARNSYITNMVILKVLTTNYAVYIVYHLNGSYR